MKSTRGDKEPSELQHNVGFEDIEHMRVGDEGYVQVKRTTHLPLKSALERVPKVPSARRASHLNSGAGLPIWAMMKMDKTLQDGERDIGEWGKEPRRRKAQDSL